MNRNTSKRKVTTESKEMEEGASKKIALKEHPIDNPLITIQNSNNIKLK